MKYNAFISYSHSQNPDLAVNLEKALEKFAKPTFKRRALNIFRDSNDLSVSPDLWGKIEEGLAQSEYFIYLASPKSANSYYCNEEVKYWLANKSMDNFLVAVVDGDIQWDFKNFDFDWNTTTAISKVLRGAFKNEPLYVDFREDTVVEELNLDNPNFKAKVVFIAATLHKKAIGDMVGEAVKQHKRTLMIRNAAVAIVMALMSLTIILTLISNRRKSASLLHFQAKAIENSDPTLALRLEQEALKVHDYPEFERSAFAMINRNSFYRIIAAKDTAHFTAMDISKHNTLLLGSSDGSISLKNLDGTLIKAFNIDKGEIRAAKFSPDGKSILSASTEGLQLWDLEGSLKTEFKLDAATETAYSATAVAFAPDGQTVLTGSPFGAHLWDLEGKRIPEFEILGAVKSVAFAPDGNAVLVGYDGSKIAANLFDLQGNTLATFTTDDPNYGEPYTIPNTVAFSPDGQTVMVCSSMNNIQLFDSEGNVKEDFNLPNFLNFAQGSWTAKFSPDGTKILTSSYENAARLWDLKGKLLTEFKGHEAMINLVVFDPTDDKTILTGSIDKTIRKWYSEGLNASVVDEFMVHNRPISSIQVSPDGKSILTSALDSTACLWDFKGRLLKKFKHNNVVDNAVFSPDGESILTQTTNGMYVWNTNGEPTQEYIPTNELISAMAFTPDSEAILFSVKTKPKSEGYNTSWPISGLRTWNWKENSIAELELGDTEATSAYFGATGKTLLTDSYGGAHLRNLQGDSLQVFKLSDERVYPVAIAPDGTSVITYLPPSQAFTLFTSSYGKSHLWDSSGALIQEFKLNNESVEALTFAPDGKSILTLSYPELSKWDRGNPTGRLWDLEGGIKMEFYRPGKDISAMIFSPDGNFIIAGYQKNSNQFIVESGENILVIYNKIGLDEFLDTYVAPLSMAQKKEFDIE